MKTGIKAVFAGVTNSKLVVFSIVIEKKTESNVMLYVTVDNCHLLQVLTN